MRTTPRSASSTIFALTIVGAGMIAAATIGLTAPTEAEFGTASQLQVTYSNEICEG